MAIVWRTIQLLLVSFVMFGCGGQKPVTIGAESGRLSACPKSPNCVNSFADASDKRHTIAVLKGSLADAKAALLMLPRVEVVTETEVYLHAQVTSFLIRYVDDVEFLFDAEQQVVHVRSASRTGHSDFGVNRRRVEAIRVAMPSP